MFNVLPFCILLLTVRFFPCAALPSLNIRETLSGFNTIRRSWLPRSNPPILAGQVAGVNYNPNGSAFLWLPSDDYSGPNFFEWVIYVCGTLMHFHWFSTSRWDFFSHPDPTKYVINAPFPLLSASFNGCCDPISVEMSSEPLPLHRIQEPRIFSSRITVASSMNQPHLPLDLYPSRKMEQSSWRRITHLTWLAVYSVIGEFVYTLSVIFEFSESTLFALSVRITSHTSYNNGLFILDLNTAPWGCGMSHTHSRLIGAPILTLLLLKLSGLLFGQ
jgi:hypothetical protein